MTPSSLHSIADNAMERLSCGYAYGYEFKALRAFQRLPLPCGYGFEP
ncbi:MAG: hypothetical protein LIP03_10685 [Bacteroidales bacterium]|nr:hypothetical protein [Bacteroidales bacterium]